jgi:Flp pilus assembly protein TadD
MRCLLLTLMLLPAACGGGGNNAPEPPLANSRPDNAPQAQPEESDRLRARRLFAEAGQLAVARDNSGAAEKLEQAVALHPEDPEIHARLGHVYIELLRYDDAREAFQRALVLPGVERRLELRARAAWCSHKLAFAAYQAQDLDGALTEIRHALELQPDNVDARMLLGHVHRESGRHAEAAEAFMIAAGHTTGEVRLAAMVLQGEELYRAGEYRAAIEVFDAMIERGADGHEPWGWRAYCHVQVGDKQQAIGDLRQAIDRAGSPDKRAEYEDVLRQLLEHKEEDE